VQREHDTSVDTMAFSVRELSVSYKSSAGERLVVSNVSYDLTAGQILGLAGETGCGKSTAALASTGFPVPGMARRTGSALLHGTDLFAAPREVLRGCWGRDIAFVPQQPSGAFSPVRKIWPQLDEALAANSALPKDERRAQIEEVIDRVGFREIPTLRRKYPFEFSGGQLQRLSLALAVLCSPKVIIFDEPTTALDPSTQEKVLELIRDLVQTRGLAALYISHDIALLRAICDELAIMYDGQIVERSDRRSLTQHPRHPYTSALLAAIPMIDTASLAMELPGEPPQEVVIGACAFAPRCPYVEEQCLTQSVELRELDGGEVRCIRADEDLIRIEDVTEFARSARPSTVGVPVLEVAEISARYGTQELAPEVLKRVSLSVANNEIVAIVGESGSGKSTLLQVLAGLHAPTNGQMSYCGESLPPDVRSRSHEVRNNIQLVFQDASAALNPRHTIGRSLSRALAVYRPQLSRGDRQLEAERALRQVKLSPKLLEALPSQISGGQQQRVNLARALCAAPKILLCDEVTSSLDVSVQAGILRLIASLRAERDLAVVFVTHDLAVVRSLADRVVIMADGEIIENSNVDKLFSNPASVQAQSLLEAAAYKSKVAFEEGWEIGNFVVASEEM
jgi:peptide/nickel transport system ATP-binding protein